VPVAEQFRRRHGVRSAWRLRPDGQVGIVALSGSGAGRACAVRELLAQGATGRVGLSPEYADALDTSRALEIAAVARRCVPPGSAGVATIDDDPVATIVASAPAFSGRAVRSLLDRVADVAPRERDVLLGTLRTWIKCGGNTSAAAQQLYCHRNTVRNRLLRIEELSGHLIKDPHGVAALAIAAEGARLLGADLAPQAAQLIFASSAGPAVS